MARLRLEKRPRGKVATVIGNLDSSGNHLDELARTLKEACGTGGTVKDDRIELQGDRLALVESVLSRLGYKVRRG